MDTDLDEATAFLLTLEATPADAPTACAGWCAHDLVAHLCAGAAEMAELVEAALAGEPARPTRTFAEREAPFGALPDPELRERLVMEALRLHAATASLAAAQGSVEFSGRRLDASALDLHGRSEAALHRWDLCGDDVIGDALLGQPELLVHGVSVLNAMLEGSAESPAIRGAGLAPGCWILRTSGQTDVAVVVEREGARIELRAPEGPADVEMDAAGRLLALWGRQRNGGAVTWYAEAGRREALSSFLWPMRDAPRPVASAAH
jgi:hypothetical protein